MGAIVLVARAAVAVALLVAGCASAPAGPPVATARVDLPASYKFAPADIVVPPGTTVTWTNDDHFTHSVEFVDGGLPTTPLLMDPGATATFVFAAAGLYHYQCSLHPQNMKGSVLVTP